MIKRYTLKDYKNIPSNVSCIGYFDGVHKGHQELIKKTITEARRLNVVPCSIIINPTKDNVLYKSRGRVLTSLKRKIELLEKHGIEAIIVIDLDIKTMSLSKDDFVKKYLNKLNIQELVCGFDFTYGYKGLGTSKTLKQDAKELFKVITVKEVTYYGKKISSTRIKNELENGNTKLVNRLLGYEYK